MTASVSVLFFLLIQTSFSEGKNTSRQEGKRGGEGGRETRTREHLCGCVYVILVREPHMYMYLCKCGCIFVIPVRVFRAPLSE